MNKIALIRKQIVNLKRTLEIFVERKREKERKEYAERFKKERKEYAERFKIDKEKFLNRFRAACHKELTEQEFSKLLTGQIVFPETLFIAVTELRPILKKKSKKK